MKAREQKRYAIVIIHGNLRDYASSRRRRARSISDFDIADSARVRGQISLAKICGLISAAQAARFSARETKITNAAITRNKLKAAA